LLYIPYKININNCTISKETIIIKKKKEKEQKKEREIHNNVYDEGYSRNST
jgi:hypothetical protein